MGSRSYLDRPRTRVRRKDRQLDDPDWQDRMLNVAAVGHVAVVLNGEPLITSNLFWYDGQAVYMHSAQVGKLRAIVDENQRPACFTVTEMGRILPAGTPFDFSTEYASVILYGEIDIVEDATEKRRVLDGIMTKYAPQLVAGIDYEPMPDSDVALTSVFRISVNERVAKHNVKPTDYPAYPYVGGSFIDAERDAGRVTVKAKELA